MRGAGTSKATALPKMPRMAERGAKPSQFSVGYGGRHRMMKGAPYAGPDLSDSGLGASMSDFARAYAAGM